MLGGLLMSIKTYRLIGKDKANELLKLVKAQDKARWVKHKANYGLDGELGNYHALFDNCMSEELLNELLKIVPDQAPLELLKVVVNHYRVEGFIPMHMDAGVGLGCEVLCLTENKGQGLSFIDENETEVFIQDEAGMCNKFEQLNTIHGVKKVDTERYSVVFIYR